LTIVDSCGWLEYFKDSPLADHYEAYLAGPDLVVPTVVLYEVYKVLCRDLSQQGANWAAARLKTSMVVPLDDRLALYAVELSLQHGLAMADAIVYATAQSWDALLVTSDSHFEGLPGVEYIERK
jgi:predicted nucleic acid-binding protein